MQVAMQTKKYRQIICGKSEEKLKQFPDNHFDGVATDPPYELGFMGKKWDASGIAYSIALWKEVLRVTKPGGHLLCFGGTRTYHRVVCAIEDAGWIIQDQMMWLYGSGFPKSSDLSKRIDIESGAERDKVWRGGMISPSVGVGGERPWMQKAIEEGGHFTEGSVPVTELAWQWAGYGTTLKPAWEPIILAMKPLEKGMTYAQNAKKYGVAGLNIDGSRIATNEKWSHSQKDADLIGTPKKTNADHQWGYKVKAESHSHIGGRFPANIILSHSPDCVFVGHKEVGVGETRIVEHENKDCNVQFNSCKIVRGVQYGKETIEVWACVPDCPVRMIDEQGIVSRKTSGPKVRMQKGCFNTTNNIYGHGSDELLPGIDYGDSGGASRFFYCAKASRTEREEGLRGIVECAHCGCVNSKTHVRNGRVENCIRNIHPTVKPIDLMKYCINLIRMPMEEQIILDPFCGSGTTLVAAEELGIYSVGIDQDLDNVITATARTISSKMPKEVKVKKDSDSEACENFDLGSSLSSSDFDDLIV